jgi:predicted RNA-binding protein with EMAP domain
MKRVLVTLSTLSIFTMSLYGYGQIDRIQDMQNMETAMSEIQKGILYNNKKMVLEGVANLKKASANVKVAPKGDMDYTAVFAKKQSKNIIKYADKVKKNIEVGHKHGAATNYTNVLGECISCHNKIRKWN